METINQFVSRHDYAEFIRNMGGRVYNKADVLDNGGGGTGTGFGRYAIL